MVVIKRKRFYEQYDTLLKRPVTLNVQIWDNDVLTADDFLGTRRVRVYARALSLCLHIASKIIQLNRCMLYDRINIDTNIGFHDAAEITSWLSAAPQIAQVP